MVFSSRNKIFFCKYWPPSYCNNGFQKNLNKKISSPLNRKSVATGCKKDSFKIYFQEMEKLLPMERIFEILEQNLLH